MATPSKKSSIEHGGADVNPKAKAHRSAQNTQRGLASPKAWKANKKPRFVNTKFLHEKANKKKKKNHRRCPAVHAPLLVVVAQHVMCCALVIIELR